MDTLVLLQAPRVGEALPTPVTCVWFFASVDLLVGLQAAALVEAATAHVAAVWLLSRVDQPVSAQVGIVVEMFSAGAAAERFLSSVHHLLEDKFLLIIKSSRDLYKNKTWYIIIMNCLNNSYIRTLISFMPLEITEGSAAVLQVRCDLELEQEVSSQYS